MWRVSRKYWLLPCPPTSSWVWPVRTPERFVRERKSGEGTFFSMSYVCKLIIWMTKRLDKNSLILVQRPLFPAFLLSLGLCICMVFFFSFLVMPSLCMYTCVSKWMNFCMPMCICVCFIEVSSSNSIKT